jgi:hypothetical protein
MIVRIGRPPLLVWAVRLALGQDVGPIPAISEARVAFHYFIVSPLLATEVASVSGVERLSELPGIDEVRLNRRPEDSVDSRESTHQGHVIRIDGMVSSHSELRDLVGHRIPSTLRLTWKFSL